MQDFRSDGRFTSLITLQYVAQLGMVAGFGWQARWLDEISTFGNTRAAMRNALSEKTKEAGPAFNRRYAWSWKN
ncbi:hypothetical protein [Mesorhizobium sp.]|uniref:hypothetical protein n=1 Tax=Mesorhizobium sp. TaxID=1871066 RepID=UPI000FE71095|nr:hypothetical protein [Mesorhizobium sp.]RWQ63706.1 MAG: hypothetical protein EOS86_23420 [Mesorhizobium sp.]